MECESSTSRYLHEDHMEFLTPGHQVQNLKDHLAAVGFIVISDYSLLSLQVRREADENKRERRNAYCAGRVIGRMLKGNLGRSVTAYYQKQLTKVKRLYPEVFTEKGHK